MAKKDLPSPDVLRQLLRYEPETGKLFWLDRGPEWFSRSNQHKNWNGRYPGTEALANAMHQGHKRGAVLGKLILQHRAIWAIHYGKWPDGVIDHMDGNPANNKIENLRDAPLHGNARNRLAAVHGTSGFKGVTYLKRIGKWHAQIGCNGKLHHFGNHDTPEKAAAAYDVAAKMLHGEYALTNEEIIASPRPRFHRQQVKP